MQDPVLNSNPVPAAPLAPVMPVPPAAPVPQSPLPQPEVPTPVVPVPEPAIDEEPVADEAPDFTEEPDPIEEPPAEEVQLPAAAYSWQASEYVHHHKGAGWYAALAVVLAILLAVAAIFKLWLSIGVFIAMGAAIVVYAQRPPRILDYEVDDSGITIAGRHYQYKLFRSYSVLSDEEWHAIDLDPTQRFMPRFSMLFGDEDLEQITAHLNRHMPRSDRRPDTIERLSRYLRF